MHKLKNFFALKPLTWFNVGGNAKYFLKASYEAELCHFLSTNDLPFWTIGGGSNVLIRDGIVDGVTIKLYKEFSKITLDNDLIIAGAACLDKTLSIFALENEISGFEFLVGIPGTVGGAVFMNAGAYGIEIKNILKWVELVDSRGNLLFIDNFDEMSYRKGNLPKNCVVTKAAFNITKSKRDLIESKMKDFLNKREMSQPTRKKTGGSTFKNPPFDLKAWECIDKAGCRGLQIGDAIVSEKHCNFLINIGNATAKDLENLGNEVKERVFKTLQIELEWEILRIGSY